VIVRIRITRTCKVKFEAGYGGKHWFMMLSFIVVEAISEEVLLEIEMPIP
jgi:hypothetical protein